MFRFCCLTALLAAFQLSAPAETFPETFQRGYQLQIAGGQPQAGGGTTTSAAETDVSWKDVIPDIIHDQKRIYWDFPRGLGHRSHWLPAVAFIGVTVTLATLDQFESPYFRKTSTYHGFNTGFSSTNTSLMIAAVPAATYLTGLIVKNRSAESTALLSGEAVADSEITAEVLKLITRRARPSSIPPNGNFARTWLDSKTITGGGFPSGHTIAAFSVATVMSRRYGSAHRWVPYVAYGLASTIGFSRVTLSAHNVSDVVAGAALGYAISRYVVLAHHYHLR